MLALQFNHLLFVLDPNLTNGTVLGILLIVVDSFSLAPIDFVKGHIVFFFVYFFKDTSIALEPFLRCFLPHYVQGG